MRRLASAPCLTAATHLLRQLPETYRWHRQPSSAVVDEEGRTSPLAALQQLRARIRTRHYSYRTECSYADWVRRFFDYVARQQSVEHPRVTSESVRDFLTHLAVHPGGVRQHAEPGAMRALVPVSGGARRQYRRARGDGTSQAGGASAGRSERAGDRGSRSTWDMPTSRRPWFMWWSPLCGGECGGRDSRWRIGVPRPHK